jgi:transcription antitermination factor NusG
VLLRNPISQPWFACYVKSRHEKHVAAILSSNGYDCFVLTYLRVSTTHKCDVPLFPGYFFSRPDATTTADVTSIPGLFFRVGDRRGPAAISDEEIEAIRRMIASGFCPQPWAYLVPGEPIYIAEGPLRGVTSTLVAANSERWLVVSVHLLQRSVAVKLDRTSLSSRNLCKRLLDKCYC